MLEKLSRAGNKKIGKDTLIFNMGSYTNCPSKKLGLCKFNDKCYAWKAERMYINPQRSCILYRNRQEKYWLETNINKIVEDFKRVLSKKRKIKYVRFNEAGDFHSQECVEKIKTIARSVPTMVFYTYTHRKDLTYRKLPDNLIISTSNFRRKNMNAFYAVHKYTEKNLKCKGDCRRCNICKTNHGKKVEVLYH